jgi:hypothetical protein
MLEVEAKLGFEAASFIYRRSYAAVSNDRKLDRFEPHPTRIFSPTLYLAGEKLDKDALAEEYRLREKAGLAGKWLDRDALLAAFGFDRDAAILSGGSAEANPILLAKALLDIAAKRGAPDLSSYHHPKL